MAYKAELCVVEVLNDVRSLGLTGTDQESLMDTLGMMPHQMQSLIPLMRKMVKVKTVIMVDTNDEDESKFVDEEESMDTDESDSEPGAEEVNIVNINVAENMVATNGLDQLMSEEDMAEMRMIASKKFQCRKPANRADHSSLRMMMCSPSDTK